MITVNNKRVKAWAVVVAIIYHVIIVFLAAYGLYKLTEKGISKIWNFCNEFVHDFRDKWREWRA